MVVDIEYQGVKIAEGVEVLDTPEGRRLTSDAPLPVSTDVKLIEFRGLKEETRYEVRVARVYEGVSGGMLVTSAGSLPAADRVVTVTPPAPAPPMPAEVRRDVRTMPLGEPPSAAAALPPPSPRQTIPSAPPDFDPRQTLPGAPPDFVPRPHAAPVVSRPTDEPPEPTPGDDRGRRGRPRRKTRLGL